MKIKYILLAIIGLVMFQSCKTNDIVPTDKTCEGSGTDTASNHPRTALYQSVLDKYVKKGLPGIIVLIEDSSGKFIGASGMADIDKGVKMSPCHVSKAASITKIFISTLLMKLAEEGMFSIDEPISKYLDDEIIKRVENADKASIRSLLNHTAGLYEIIEDKNFYLNIFNKADRHWTSEELISFAYDKPAVFPYGTSAAYSNTNYLLLGMIMDKAAGRHHSELMKEKIFEPLGLQNTFYHWHHPLPAGKVAQGYYDLYNNGTLLNLSNWNTGSGNGYGGLYSTVSDMKTFIQFLCTSNFLINRETYNEMLKISDIEENKKYLGTGLFKDFIYHGTGNYGYGHRGRDLAYTADLFYFPERGITLSLLMNYGTDATSALKPVFDDFRNEIAEEALRR